MGDGKVRRRWMTLLAVIIAASFVTTVIHASAADATQIQCYQICAADATSYPAVIHGVHAQIAPDCFNLPAANEHTEESISDQGSVGGTTYFVDSGYLVLSSGGSYGGLTGSGSSLFWLESTPGVYFTAFRVRNNAPLESFYTSVYNSGTDTFQVNYTDPHDGFQYTTYSDYDNMSTYEAAYLQDQWFGSMHGEFKDVEYLNGSMVWTRGTPNGST